MLMLLQVMTTLVDFFPLFNCLVFLPFSWAHNAFSMEFCHKNVHCVPKLEMPHNEHCHYGNLTFKFA